MIDLFLSDIGEQLPYLVAYNLRQLGHSILPLYDGNEQSVVLLLDHVTLSREVETTENFWGRRVMASLDVLGDYLRDYETDRPDVILECLRTLKKHQRLLPAPAGSALPSMAPPREPGGFLGATDLVDAFQDRGTDLDRLRDLIANSDHKVMVVTGAVGIGKTDFLNWAFRKQLADWQVFRVPVPAGSGVARVLAQLGFELGTPVDIDALGRASHKVFRQRVKKLLQFFFSQQKRLLVVDDLLELLRDRSPRYYRQLETFIAEAAQPESFVGGRIILVSSRWLPDKWLRLPGVVHLPLRRIMDLYINRIVEYHLRRLKLISSEARPHVPQPILDLIDGHPLAARLVTELLRSIELADLNRELTRSQITGRLADELLKRINLSPQADVLVRRLAVFRLPVRLDVLRRCIAGSAQDVEVLLSIADGSILHFDGTWFDMHEAVRRYFRGKQNPEQRAEAHKLAVEYYRLRYQQERAERSRDPSVIAELAFHLAASGDAAEARRLKLVIVEEIGPAARRSYKEEQNYEKALELYRLLTDVAGDDPQMWAYVGRCYARLGRWPDSDDAFSSAVLVAEKTGHPIWWLYRDWGHIRARFAFYREAEDYLQRASRSQPNDPGINAAFAYMRWRQGDVENAADFYEKALAADPDHHYSLKYYPQVLEALGDYPRADTLRQRLRELEARDWHGAAEPEYELEFEDE